jgi:hypothetical protein
MDKTVSVMGWTITATAKPVADKWGASCLMKNKGEPLDYTVTGVFDSPEAACEAALAFGDRMVLENSRF